MAHLRMFHQRRRKIVAMGGAFSRRNDLQPPKAGGTCAGSIALRCEVCV